MSSGTLVCKRCGSKRFVESFKARVTCEVEMEQWGRKVETTPLSSPEHHRIGGDKLECKGCGRALGRHELIFEDEQYRERDDDDDYDRRGGLLGWL